MQKFDAIVIGTGQAGPPLAARLVEAGMKVAVIERKFFGGTCVNTGCIPTKTLVASACATHIARRAYDFGLRLQGEIAVDMKAVKARKDAISRQSRMGVERWMNGLKSCTVYLGHAHFLSPREIAVGDQVLTSERVFINVGGRASVPRFPGLEEVKYLTNSSMMEIDFLPEHLLIIGGSYVGLEFAQMYRRFGSAVTVIEMQPGLIAREDEDVSNGVAEILEQEGIDVRLNAKCLSVARQGNGISVAVDCAAGPPQVTGSHLLLAAGRRPNTDDLGVDKAGLVVDARGYIQVDDQLRTNVPGIWALGDCNGKARTPHTTISKSSRRIFSTTISAALRTVFPPMRSISIPRWGGLG